MTPAHMPTHKPGIHCVFARGQLVGFAHSADGRGWRIVWRGRLLTTVHTPRGLTIYVNMMRLAATGSL